MGAIRDAIETILADGQLTLAQKKRLIRRVRAQALRDNMPLLPFTFTPGPLTITVESARYDVDDDYIEVVLTASITATGAPIALNNPFRYVNPPVSVEDPTGDLSITIRNRDGTVTGVRIFKEAPLLALRSIIIDSVVGQMS